MGTNYHLTLIGDEYKVRIWHIGKKSGDNFTWRLYPNENITSWDNSWQHILDFLSNFRKFCIEDDYGTIYSIQDFFNDILKDVKEHLELSEEFC